MRLAALEMCEDISIEIVPISHWTFTCFSKNDHTFPQFFSKLISIGCLSLIQGRSQNLKEVPQSFTEVFYVDDVNSSDIMRRNQYRKEKI